MAVIDTILTSFGLQPSDFSIQSIGSGHIHKTYKLGGAKSYILQRVNKHVFVEPEIIASNLRIVSDYLKANFPSYPFLTSLRSLSGKEMEYDNEGFPWRIFPYIENTITIDKVSSPEEAFGAAREFGMLTRFLDKIGVDGIRETIPQFHDLPLRQRQFEEALANAGPRATKAAACIDACRRAYPLVEKYRALVNSGSLRLRIVHNDTKINNILLDITSRKVVGVIDLDTLMPGYFIYDLGDMVRTYVCPVSEEEKDLSRISFRKEVYTALLEGYLSEMKGILSPGEIAAIPFAGKMMTYIMALRFLADFLRGNTYYHTTYPDQNLVRASNQLRLLEVLEENVK